MLRTRVITALVLLTVLLVVLYSGSFLAFAAATAVFFAAAIWECFRLFGSRFPRVGAAVWTVAFAVMVFNQNRISGSLLFAVCAAIWLLRLVPSLAIGLPTRESSGNRLLSMVYGVAILGCFLAMAVLVRHSPLYLFSVLAIVWIADIGAYFAGKAFGQRKLAPTISPGKSWEGAVGGWLAVVILGAMTTLHPVFHDTFTVQVHDRAGWTGLILVLTVLVAASIVGDLFESQLKRRAGMKDSSNLLPGHGGVLDRIDALIPALPLAVLVGVWI